MTFRVTSTRRKRVRERCGAAEKLKLTSKTIAAAGATGRALGAYDKTLPTLPLPATLCAPVLGPHGT